MHPRKNDIVLGQNLEDLSRNDAHVHSVGVKVIAKSSCFIPIVYFHSF